jgi:hypothetical protein
VATGEIIEAISSLDAMTGEEAKPAEQAARVWAGREDLIFVETA